MTATTATRTLFKLRAARLSAFALALCSCALVLCAAQALARVGGGGRQDAKKDESLLTQAGTLSIVQIGEESDLKMELRLNGKKVQAIEGDMYAGFKAHFRDLEMGEVIVMWVSEGGTACPAQFRIIRVEGTGKVSVTDEFGDCGDSPTITLQLLPDEQIALRFQGYYHLNDEQEPGFQKPPPTTWVYKKGVLKELKAAPPVKRRGK
ncbi:MAG: hypothetical protein QOH51_1677 [Acidobacteriota bacterium]|jgi:hypothetical protein|nr:hypothetical protein [Acidobacteriota bacterium]